MDDCIGAAGATGAVVGAFLGGGLISRRIFVPSRA